MEAVKMNKKFPDLPPQNNGEIAILELLQGFRSRNLQCCKVKRLLHMRISPYNSFELLDQDLWEFVENRGEGLCVPEIHCHSAGDLQHLSSFRNVHVDIRTNNVMVVVFGCSNV